MDGPTPHDDPTRLPDRDDPDVATGAGVGPARGLASTVRFREALHAVPMYVPGRPPTAPAGAPTYKMSSNENPYPPLPGVIEAAGAAAETMNRYPDMACTQLREAIAADLRVTAGEVVPGAGSSGVLSAIVTATCEAGAEVVYAWRSFEAYPIMVGLAGARSVQVPLSADGRHDLPAMARATSPATRLVLVCSPNNPTGPAVHAGELEEFLAVIPPHVLVVLDEAYLEFVRDPAAPDALALYRTHPNVAVLRTFSKAYGLAGLRVGYGLLHEGLADRVRSATLPFGVSTVGSDAAVASLARRDELLARVDAGVAERERLRAALLDQGWDVPDAQGNFVWLPLRHDALDFAAAADAAGLAVRPFAGDGVRCSVDEPAANTRLMEVAAAFRARA